MFSSDQLTIPSFVEDLLRNPRFSPFTWMIPRAPYVFPDLPGYFLVRLFTGDAYLAVLIYSVLHVTVVAFAAKLVLDRVFPDRCQARLAILVFLALCGITLALSSALPDGNILEQPFVSLTHATAVVSALVMFCVYEALIESRALWKHMLVVSICAISIFSDKFFLVFFCASYAAALLLTGMTNREWRKLAIFIAEMVVALAISLWMDRSFVQQITEPIEFKPLIRLATVAQVVWNLGVSPWLWLLAGLIAALIIAWRAGPLASGAAHVPVSSLRARIFMAALTGLGLGVGVLLWREPIAGFQRYIVGFEFGALLCAAMVVADLAMRKQETRRGVIILMIFAVVIAIAAAHPINPLRPLIERREIADSMAACRSRFQLESGYAGYWVARKVSMATGWQTQVNQFLPDTPRLFFWGNNFLWFYYDSLSGQPSRANFIIEQGLKRSEIDRLYGKPMREGDCGPFHVLVYADDSALRIRALATLFSQVWIERLTGHLPKDFMEATAPARRTMIDIATMHSQIGTVVDGAVIARAPVDHAAFLLYGPYLNLPAGSYAVDIAFVCADNTAADVFDATAQAGKQVLAVARIEPGDPRCNGSNQTITLPFALKQAADAVEFRTLFSGQGTLKVTGLVLRRE